MRSRTTAEQQARATRGEHWCSGSCPSAGEPDRGELMAGQVAHAMSLTGTRTPVSVRPARLAGSSPVWVIRRPDVRTMVICQGTPPAEVELRVQAARLDAHGWQAMWVCAHDPAESAELAAVRMTADGPVTARTLAACLDGGGPVDAGQFRAAATQMLDLYVWEQECWRCRRDYPAVGVGGVWRSRCGRPADHGDQADKRRFELSDPIAGAAVAQALADGRLRSGRRVALRYSHTERERYWANVCSPPHKAGSFTVSP